MDHRVLTRRALEAFAWMLCYGALWGLFAEGAWLAGLPWVVLAVAVRLALGASTAPLAWSALPGLLAFFLRHMVAGAWDVGRRALHPRRPLSPGWVSYRLQWPDGPGAPLLAALVGLLPGTASAMNGTNCRAAAEMTSRCPLRTSKRYRFTSPEAI